MSVSVEDLAEGLGHSIEPARLDPLAVSVTGSLSDEEKSFGPILILWMALALFIQGSLWLTGFRGTDLKLAIDQGAARVESQFIGEVGDDVIRKAVRTQRDTLPFWTVIAFLGDFLGEPAWLGVRALGVATAFAAVAALMGRPIGYDRALVSCAWAQGLWIAGMALRAGLMIGLKRREVETSAVLLLPVGSYPAWLWLTLRQVDAFAMLGWLVVGPGGLRRGQVRFLGSLLICGGFWLFESVLRVGFGLLVGAGMRLSVWQGS